MPGGQVSAVRTPTRASKSSTGGSLLIVAIAIAVLALAIFLLSRAGAFLIVYAPEKSDVIVVLDGEWQKAMELQQKGFAPRVLLDAGVNRWLFGHNEAQLAAEFLKTAKLGAFEICPTTAGTTYAEAADVQRCLEPLHPKSVLLVASNFDTRRTLEIFRKRLPQYQWSIAASSWPYHYADQYWKHRAWAKTVLYSWEQYLYWKAVEQWRSDIVLPASASEQRG